MRGRSIRTKRRIPRRQKNSLGLALVELPPESLETIKGRALAFALVPLALFKGLEPRALHAVALRAPFLERPRGLLRPRAVGAGRTGRLADGRARHLARRRDLHQANVVERHEGALDVRRAGVVAASCSPSNIEMVDQHPSNRDAAALKEDGLEGENIREMLTAAVGIVGDNDITVVPALNGHGAG